MDLRDNWFEISSDIKVEKLGYIDANIPHPSRNGVPYWVLVLIQKGSRSLYVDGKELRVGTREFFLLPPNTEQKPLDVDDHTACYAHFYAYGKQISAPTQIDASCLRLPICGYLPSDIDCFDHMKYLCDHAVSPYASKEFLAAQLYAVLSVISLQCQRNPHFIRKNASTNANAYLAFIKDNACRFLRAEDYETAFDKSYHQINLVFKRQFGSTVKQYHLRVRMECAAQMLLSGKTIQETATSCGFEDYYFFIRCFTKVHGMSPAAYRKRHGA